MPNDFVSLRLMEEMISDIGNSGSSGGRFVIPFASTRGPRVSCGATGSPVNVAPLGFGFSDATYTVPISGSGLIDLTGTTNDDRQFSFSVPVDCVIENIFMDAGPWEAMTVASGTELFPFVELYQVPPSNNMFMPIPETKTEPSSGFTGSVVASQLLSASKIGIGTKLAAGTRVMIVGEIEATGTGTLTNAQYMYFTGGISFISSDSVASAQISETAICAQNTSGDSLAVTLLSATAIPLSSISYSSGFAMSADGNTCTISDAGTYVFRYRVSGTVSVGMSFGLALNGDVSDASQRTALVSVGDITCEMILPVASGTTVQLQVSGVLGTVLLASGVGAELIISRIA